MFRDGLRFDTVDARTSGTWVAGSVLSFSGTAIVPGTAGATFGTATLDFGAAFTDAASVTITGQAWVAASSGIHAWIMDDVTADNTAGEHELLSQDCKLVVTNRVAATGFNIDVYTEGTLGKGQFTVHWEGE